MTNAVRGLIVSASLLTLAACAAGPPPAPIAPPPVPAEMIPPRAGLEPQVSAHDQQFQLFKDSDEASLRRNPLNAIFRGDMRYAEHFGDNISDQ